MCTKEIKGYKERNGSNKPYIRERDGDKDVMGREDVQIREDNGEKC